MAYGFNDDKSKVQVLTAGDIKIKQLSIGIPDNIIIPKNGKKFVSLSQSDVNFNSIIGVIRFASNFPDGIVISGWGFDSAGRVNLDIVNLTSADFLATGYRIYVWCKYIDQ